MEECREGTAAAPCVIEAYLFHGSLTKSQHEPGDWLHLFLDQWQWGSAASSWGTMRDGLLQVNKQTRHKWAMFWITLLVMFLVAFAISIIGGYTAGWTWTRYQDHDLSDGTKTLFFPVKGLWGTTLGPVALFPKGHIKHQRDCARAFSATGSIATYKGCPLSVRRNYSKWR